VVKIMISRPSTVLIIAIATLAGCKWTELDDLAATTWVHSQTKPKGENAADYGVAIANVTSNASGGELAVLGNDAPSYSTLVYDGKGKTTVGPNPQSLSQHFIVSLGDAPIILADGTGKVAIVSSAIDTGNVAVVSGPAEAVADTTFPGGAPQAAAFDVDGKTLFVVAPDPSGTSTNVKGLMGTAMHSCTVTDDTGAPLAAAAIASDGAFLWVWSKTGFLFGYSLAALASTGMKGPDTGALDVAFVPGSGARIHIVGSFAAAHDFAVLVAHGDRMTNGQVTVVDLKTATGTLPPTIVGTPLGVDGIRSSAVDTLGSDTTKTYVILGFPDRPVGSVKSGQVELHELDANTGTLTGSPADTLHDAQPEGNELFGRSVAVMRFNDQHVLAVAASNEIFAYYETALYPDTR
jgi:hypothetical protein